LDAEFTGVVECLRLMACERRVIELEIDGEELFCEGNEGGGKEGRRAAE
jgi:hypothetical protein